MKKVNSIIVLTFLFCFSAFAQENDFYIKNRKSNLEIYKEEDKFNQEQNLNHQVSKKNSFGLSFIESEKSEKLSVLNQTYNNVEIYSAKIRTIFDRNKQAILSSNSTMPNFKVLSNSFPDINKVKNSGKFIFDSISSYKKYYFPVNESNITASLKVNYKLNSLEYFIFLDAELNTLYKGERFFHKKDFEKRPANASVFLPDPITSANTSYGGDFIHNAGNTNPALEAQQFDVQLECKYENGTYYLENEYIKIEDMFSPYWSVVKSTDGNFIFNRSQTGFQQVNAFYHLSEMKKQLQLYGFNDAVNYQIRVDADGARGMDNSFFHPHDYERGEDESASTLEFGAYLSSSGYDHVPDAEDAEVLVHEYTHAIINSYARERISTERLCLEEALADYIAVSYATAINPYNWEKVFKWDAHNEYWEGRYATSNKCYTNLYFYNNRDHIDIWLAPLMELYFEIGREETDKLVLHSLVALDAYTTMKQAAKIIMTMDYNYNSCKYSQQIFNTFNKYCILNEEDLDFENCILSEENPDFESVKNYEVLNSENFTRGSFLTIKFNKLFSGNVKIYNLAGQEIESIDYRETYFINIDSKNLNKGIFLVKIQNLLFEDTFKVVKL